jgi:hypothetical protein
MHISQTARSNPGKTARIDAGKLLLGRAFHQLEAVPEWVEDVDASITVEGNIRFHDYAGVLAGSEDLVHGVDDQRGMCSLGGMEMRLESEMQANRTCREPDAVALGHCRGFLNFNEAENVDVESPRAIFSAHGDCDLYVLDAEDGHRLANPRVGLVRVNRAWHLLTP